MTAGTIPASAMTSVGRPRAVAIVRKLAGDVKLVARGFVRWRWPVPRRVLFRKTGPSRCDVTDIERQADYVSILVDVGLRRVAVGCVARVPKPSWYTPAPSLSKISRMPQ